MNADQSTQIKEAFGLIRVDYLRSSAFIRGLPLLSFPPAASKNGALAFSGQQMARPPVWLAIMLHCQVLGGSDVVPHEFSRTPK